jgi:protein phosphatase
MPRYVCACRSIRGARKYQEDRAEVRAKVASPGEAAADAAEVVAVLADGMGGHAGGALASETVCAAFLGGFEAASGTTVDRLAESLAIANDALAAMVVDRPHLAGMGSTLVGAAFGDAGLEWVSVGDSPLYLWRRGETAVVNEDHSLAPLLDRLVVEGRLTAEEARDDPRRHHLRSAVTGEEIELVDSSQKALALEPGDCVILASDGIHTLSEAQIAEIVGKSLADGPDAIADRLLDAVVEARDPAQDNTTVVVVHVEAW